MRNLVVLVQFPDLMGTRTRADFDALFNTLGYTVDGAQGSVRDYYREVSYNALDVVSVVTDWITVANSYAYYGANDAHGNDLHPREMVQEALTALEANGFDFSTLDADGDGWVDGLTVIHAGGGEEYSGNDPNYIWSHKWSMLTTLTFDGKSMRDYHTEPERRGWDSSPATQGITRIGVICHETGHFLGLPDLYDTGYDSEGAGNFCLMAGGSWNGNYGTSPAHMSAWCKKRLNWLSPTLVTSAGTYTVPRVEESMTAFRLSGPFASTEYFLVENRQGYGFDAALPGSTRGLLIWHVDEAQSNNDNQSHYLVDLEEASGTQHLELNQNAGNDADYYRLGNSTSFTASTTPNNLSYTGTPLKLDITSVSASGPTMTFTIAPLPVDHFGWDTITSPQPIATPFAVTITARDWFGNAVPTFTGQVNLSGLVDDAAVVGTGMAAWAYPIPTSYRVARTQVIYHASEIGDARTIIALDLHVITCPAQTLKNWTIRMKHTSLSTYPASPAWEGTGWTTAYQSDESVSATGWVRFTFSTPFAFNGADNLMIDFSYNNTSSSTDGQCHSTTTGSTRTIFCGTTSRYGNPLNWSGTSSPKPNGSTSVPDIRLTSQTAVTISPTASSAFVNGIWAGDVAVYEPRTSMVLQADDGAGHAGTSGSFAVNANQAPTLDPINSLAINEDSGLQTISLTGISAGPGENQTLTVTATSGNPGLIPDPSVTYTSPNAIGSLSFTPAANASGNASVTVVVHDNAGTASGGTDTTTRSFTVTVNPVNDAPSFVGGPNKQAAQNAATQAFPGWATSICAGPPDESSQTLHFTVNNDKTYLFSAQPTVANDGTLAFAPNGKYRGTATARALLQDNGGIANGGTDTSPEWTFTITVGLEYDGDGNGLPDDWEAAFFGATGTTPDDDSDGDGFTNAQELLAGTNPNDPDDAPGITATQQSGTDVAISFKTVPGKTYRVERSDLPAGGTWRQVDADVPGTGQVLTVTDQDRALDQHCFYRVVVVP
jgi:immune inhibitor A